MGLPHLTICSPTLSPRIKNRLGFKISCNLHSMGKTLRTLSVFKSSETYAEFISLKKKSIKNWLKNQKKTGTGSRKARTVTRTTSFFFLEKTRRWIKQVFLFLKSNQCLHKCKRGRSEQQNHNTTGYDVNKSRNNVSNLLTC